MSFDYLLSLDQSLLLALNGSDSLYLDGLMLTYTSGFTWIPLYVGLLYLVIKNNETMLQILWAVLCFAICIFISDLLADGIVKPLVHRYRPCSDPSIKYIVDIANDYRSSDFSFYSAHASNTMSIAMLSLLIVRNRLFTVFMISWSLLNCYTRLYLGMHYPSDIIVGLALGMVVGYLTYLLYRVVFVKISQNPNYISTYYSKTGYALSDINVVLLLIVICLLYGIIKALYIC